MKDRTTTQFQIHLSYYFSAFTLVTHQFLIMAVTEIAHLSLLNTSLKDSQLRQKLKQAQQSMQAYTGRTFYLMRRPLSNSVVYIIGEWDSVDHHKEWLVTDENQRLLQLLKDDVEVDWMIHIDAPHEALPLPKSLGHVHGGDESAVIYSFDKHAVVEGEKHKYEEFLNSRKESYEGSAGKVDGATVGSGWVIEKANSGRDTFFVLAAWKSLDTHKAWHDGIVYSEHSAAVDDSGFLLLLSDRIEEFVV
ncbi:unnamed protein product [Periconia digitata]|uniref:ABM domain-containing protein n=1 Tax=Periconia digitata TaxID=1303443 RepID=A0A9W4U3U7_9PLEO|nr:unnamed protein product [Periconia digitata]